jgi:hypothetical protein
MPQSSFPTPFDMAFDGDPLTRRTVIDDDEEVAALM